MSKRILITVALVTALSASASFAQSAPAQKEKSKAKEKTAPAVAAQAEAPSPFVLETPMAWGNRSYLGVYLEEVTPERVKELNLSEERGAVIMKVVPGGPAEKAGLKENDVIVSFNGRRVDSVRELQRLLNDTPEGRNVSIEVMRGGRSQTVAATLSKRSSEMALYSGKMGDDLFKHNQEAMKRAEEALKRSQEALKYKEKTWPDFGNFNFVGPGEFYFFHGSRLGVSVESLTEQLGEFFGVKDGHGVLVTEVRQNSAAAAAGLKAGDVITEVDNVRITNVREMLTEINKKPEGAVTLKVIRNRSEQTLTVTLEKSERRSLVRPRPRARAVRVTATA